MSKKFDPRILLDVALFIGTSTSIYYILSYLIGNVGQQGPSASKTTQKKALESKRRLRLTNPDALSNLDEYESILLANVVSPDEIATGFSAVGGLDDIIEELREAVLYPLMEPEVFSAYSSLLSAPKGVLLYGPPGCGKTMLAKALAKESGANFLNIKMSAILDKWLGESNKLVAAIFSLAQKLEPCIVFIDEIDSFLRERASSDHEITAMLKAEFMTLWDGLTTGGRVMVLGATNRPNDIDKAILRRMPKKFAVPLPKTPERLKIFRLVLKDVSLEPSFDWDFLGDQSIGMSGSDINEVCRDAVMKAARETIRMNFKGGQRVADHKMRNLRTDDFFNATAAAPKLPFNIVPELD
ncbi:Protein MSP1 [Wickerhamiella sorbophila]|uniref:Protein MSP1 n=1 Tax=Wickerhamiella sorbophila TaxID=45607 RepID=A0A2T0FGQ3_9ASCO|nr:Protein MSP1 [Wickerhamiella sorbophila]PRT54160.1 Protein MSP1 [Wickerhamiella sorbophila]